MAAFQFPANPVDTETAVNPITGSTYQWRADLSKWVLTRSPETTGSDLIWEGDNPPDPIGDYKLWYSTDTLELYFYYCDTNGVCAWLPTSVPIQVLEDLNAFAAQAELDIDQLQYKQQLLQVALDDIYLTQQQQQGDYVKKTGGDTMEGQLVINGPRKAGDDPNDPDLVSSVKVLNIDNAQNSSLQLRHGGNAKVYIGDTDVSIASDIKVVRAAGSIVKTDDADLINIVGEEVSYTGKIENEKNIVTKQYVDDADEALRQDIIELEEEIDAIAPSVEYGTWVWKNPSTLGRPPLDGEFYLLTEALTTTDDYINTKHIVIHNDEYGGTGTHGWIDADPGKLIQLFDAADPDFLLGEITATDIKDTYVIITVDLIQSNGTPGDNLDPDTGAYLTRINIFEKPSGGDASGFVLKTGDTMTGTLQMDGDAAIKTRNLDSGQNSNLEIKHNGVSKVYVGADQTAFQHHIKFAQTGKQVYAGTDLKGLAFYADGVQYVGNYTADKHVATKKNVEEAIYHNPADTSTNKYVDRSGDTMSGDLEIKTPDWGEAALVLNGKRDNTSNASTTISFKNQLDTADAYSGYLTYRSTGSAAGFFRFNRNLDLNGQRLTMLASPSSDNDAANKKYVDDAVAGAGSGLPSGGSKGQVLKMSRDSTSVPKWQGAVDINTSGSNRAVGEIWYNQNDGNLYLRIS